METSKQGRLFIASSEGLCLRPYFDGVGSGEGAKGVLTVGIGSTKSDIPNLANWDKAEYPPLQELIDIFAGGLLKYEEAVNSSIHVDISQTEFDACVSLCYNIGGGGFSKSTLVRNINSKASPDTIYNSFMMWNKPKEILGRRTKEATLYRRGIYPTSQIVQTDTDGEGKEVRNTSKVVDLSSYF